MLVEDVCTIIEKCSIDEISKYLIKEGKEKNFQILQLDSKFFYEKNKYSNYRLGNIGVIYINISIKIKKYYPKKTTVFQILLMYLQKLKIKKDKLRFLKRNG